MTLSYPTGEDFASNFPKNSSKSNASSFDIRDHLDKLEPGKEKDKYICPVCSGRNLSIAPKTGAYQCWSGGCATNDIRDAIRPLAEFLAERKGEQLAPQVKKPRAKKKEYSAVPIPIGARLLVFFLAGKGFFFFLCARSTDADAAAASAPNTRSPLRAAHAGTCRGRSPANRGAAGSGTGARSARGWCRSAGRSMSADPRGARDTRARCASRAARIASARASW